LKNADLISFIELKNKSTELLLEKREGNEPSRSCGASINDDAIVHLCGAEAAVKESKEQHDQDAHTGKKKQCRLVGSRVPITDFAWNQGEVETLAITIRCRVVGFQTSSKTLIVYSLSRFSRFVSESLQRHSRPQKPCLNDNGLAQRCGLNAPDPDSTPC
jgi:hypothetical protein